MQRDTKVDRFFFSNKRFSFQIISIFLIEILFCNFFLSVVTF